MHKSLILNLHEIGCSNNCVFCGKHENIRKEEAERIAREELKKLEILNKDADIREIIISGNDPLEYHDFLGFLKEIKEAANVHVCLNSHCLNFGDIGFLRKVLAVGALDSVQIPVYGHCPAIHDSVTRNRGSFDSLMKSIDNLVCEGFENIRFQTLFLKQNEDFIVDLYSFLLGFGYPINASLPSIPTLRGRYMHSHTRNIPDINKVRRKLSQVRNGFQCDEMLFFNDIPFCISGFHYNIGFSTELGRRMRGGYSHFKGSDVETLENNNETIASYRLLSKTSDCRRCFYNDRCFGITKPYTDLGVFRPIPFGNKLF